MIDVFSGEQQRQFRMLLANSLGSRGYRVETASSTRDMDQILARTPVAASRGLSGTCVYAEIPANNSASPADGPSLPIAVSVKCRCRSKPVTGPSMLSSWARAFNTENAT